MTVFSNKWTGSTLFSKNIIVIDWFVDSQLCWWNCREEKSEFRKRMEAISKHQNIERQMVKEKMEKRMQGEANANVLDLIQEYGLENICNQLRLIP